MTAHLRPTLVLLGLFSLLCGVAYPLAVTGIARLAFPAQAAGSLVVHKGEIVGSRLIGQSFRSAKYFHGRPSAAGSYGNDAANSAGSNLAATSKALRLRVETERLRLQAENPGLEVPAELLYASASGLDPDISPAAARYQIHRVAAARGLGTDLVASLVAAHSRGRWLGLFGEPTVNVLSLNLALDAAEAKAVGALK